MTPEGKVKAEIKAYLDSLAPHCWYFMPSMMGYGRKGIPDIIGCYCGYLFSVEVKAPGKRDTLTPWQKKECDAINKAGAMAFVTDDSLHFKRVFNAILEAA